MISNLNSVEYIYSECHDVSNINECNKNSYIYSRNSIEMQSIASISSNWNNLQNMHSMASTHYKLWIFASHSKLYKRHFDRILMFSPHKIVTVKGFHSEIGVFIKLVIVEIMHLIFTILVVIVIIANWATAECCGTSIYIMHACASIPHENHYFFSIFSVGCRLSSRVV